ncbi:MAG: hypothetical protein NTY53_09155 [Kiritimatiellaeota bacterium]|nr:hypothetical protein [Kiritimatiellota bacterium]
MRILLIAPQPFYQERGTPIAVDLLLRVLSERGDEVHVATFHEGADVVYPGVTLHRIPPPPLARGVASRRRRWRAACHRASQRRN